MTARWKFVDPSTGDEWTHPINPRRMTPPPLLRKQMRFASGARVSAARVRAFRAPTSALPWEFSGVIRSQAHHDSLLEWAKKKRLIEVHDHLGRVFEVVITSFEPSDRRPTAHTPWRLTYSMKTLMLRRTA